MKRKGLKKKKSNNNFLWKIVDDIKIHKNGSLLDNPKYEKEFNAFLILRALSMDESLIDYANIANEFQGVLSKKEMYKLLIEIVPVTTSRCKWVKSNSDDNPYVDMIMEYYGCNRREAIMYIDLFGEKWSDEVKAQFGGSKN